MDWSLHAQMLEPGEASFVPCSNERCVTGVVGLCLYCEQTWAWCGCGRLNFNCECGHCVERTDEYLTHRVAALEVAILEHRKAKGEDADEHDLALYAKTDEI